MVPRGRHALTALVREPQRLAQGTYDLAIVGGGIYGACVAREAARAGLSVALVERADFGHATSWNSLRTLHGGIRYLQHLDLIRLRHAVRDRRFWMRLAPDLTCPMPFVLPTRGWGVHGPGILAAGCVLFDALAADRNLGVCEEHRLRRSRVVGRTEAHRLLQPMRPASANGAIIWYEAVAANTERLLLRVLQEAVACRAVVQNYCEVIGREQRNGLHVLRVVDRLTGAELRLGARVVINAAGPAVDDVGEALQIPRSHPMMRPSRAFNLVLRRPAQNDHALGVPVRRATSDPDAHIDRGENTYFVIPWGNYTLVGTRHLPAARTPSDPRITREEMLAFVHELNEAAAAQIVHAEDIVAVLSGIVPAAQIDSESEEGQGEVQLLKRHRIVDHREEGYEGILSVLGGKITNQRFVAEETVDIAAKMLRTPARSVTARRPYYGAVSGDFERFVERAAAEHTGSFGLTEAQVRRLARTYAGALPRLLDRIRKEPRLARPLVDGHPATLVEVHYGVEVEMVQRTQDFLLRRTGLGLDADLALELAPRVADAIGALRGWDRRRVEQDVEDYLAAIEPMRVDEAAWRALEADQGK